MLRFGDIEDALHLNIDMQRLFSERTDWHVRDFFSIVPTCAALLQHASDAALFARFVTPVTADDASGAWQRYYRRWSGVTLGQIAPELLDLIVDLTRLAPEAPVLDKAGYSAFSNPDFATLLVARNCRTLILSGIETDVCVLSTALEAVDRGLRVIVAQDAVASGSSDGHRAALDILKQRFDMQVELAGTAEIIEAWKQ